jgi:hypothetical protein
MVRAEMAKIRAYGIRIGKPDDASEASLRALGSISTWRAEESDKRTLSQKKAAFVAEWRRLAVEDGVDPTDSTRFGPAPKRPRSKDPRTWQSSDPVEEAAINALIAQGYDWNGAYAQVHNLDANKLRREEVDALMRANAPGAKTLRDAYKQHYEEMIHSAWLAAEDGTRGHLLNEDGETLALAGNLSPIELFSGPSARAYKYASEELKRWWAEHPPPRMSFEDWRKSVQGDPSGLADSLQKQKGNEFV